MKRIIPKLFVFTLLIILVQVMGCKKDKSTSQLYNVELKVITLNSDTIETTQYSYGQDMMLGIKLINNSGTDIKLSGIYPIACSWWANEDFLFVYKIKPNTSLGFVPVGRPYVYPVICQSIYFLPHSYPVGESLLICIPWKENPENWDLYTGKYFTHFSLNLTLEDGTSRNWDLRRDFEVK
jgi:hypothetical protein